MTRYYIIATIALGAVLAGGCARPKPGTVREPPRVRVEGARILDPDPELLARIENPVPAADLRTGTSEVDLPDPSMPPAGVAEGVTVSVDVIDARATEVLRGLAYQGSVDLVLAGQTDQRVTLRVQDRPWGEAFRGVLQAAHLMAEWDGNRVRVVTTQQLQTEQQTTEQLELLRPRTAVIPLYSLLAKDAAKTLTSMCSAAGRIGLDEERNTLIVTDTSSHVEAIRLAVHELDTTPLQVMIEAIIVDVTLSDELHYGFDWTLTKVEGDQFTLQQRLTVGAGINPAANPGGQIQYTFLGDNWTIGGVYDMLQTFDSAKILANPKVLAVNNRLANIEIIEEIPYQELTQTSEGGQIGTTNFKEVGVKLEVTPRIGDDGAVHLDLSVEQSSDTGAAINQIPVVQTRRSRSVMTMRDGQIAVLGGLRRHRTVTNEDKIPILGDIPWLGILFRRVQTVDVDTELVLFIRAKLVPRHLGLTPREKKLAEALDHMDRRPQIQRTDPLRRNAKIEDDRTRRVP
ncbi:MAG TPA: secretin N-terminal domain-containing protein [Phycisphaerae bacterium]|nr:secretin N-terminal domain-containing protein [Phycisphaerae bacterium]